MDELDAYAMEHGLTLEQQDSGIKPIDLDAVAYWIRNPDAESVNCIAFLERVAISSATLRERWERRIFDPDIDVTGLVYDKLFWETISRQ